MSDAEMKKNQSRWRWTLIVMAWAAAAAGLGESAVVRGVSEIGIARVEGTPMVPLEDLYYAKSALTRHRRREQVPDFVSGFDGRDESELVDHGGDRDRKNVPRCKQIKGATRRHSAAGESRDWPIMTTMPTTTTVMPQRFPTYVPIVGARALSNLDVFFAHLFENMVALQQEGGGHVLGHKRTTGVQLEGEQGTQRTQRGPMLVCPEGYVLDDPNRVFFTGAVSSGGSSSFLPVVSDTNFRKGSARTPYRTMDLLLEDELMGESRAGVRSKARQQPSFWKWQSISLGKRGRS